MLSYVQVWPDKLEVVASFCYLGDKLSAASSCGFNHNMCENCLEEVQGAATSSLLLPPPFQDTWQRVQLLCAECNVPCQWDLAIDKAKLSTSAVKWQDNEQTDLQCQATRHCHHQNHWATCAVWHWGSGPHSEGENALYMWNAPVMQSRQPLTYRLIESVGLGDPRWHGSGWQRGIAESGSSWLSIFMIDIPGLRSAMRATRQLPERGPIDVTVAPVLAC